MELLQEAYPLGELVIATGADALDIDTLAGGLLGIVLDSSNGRKEAMAKAGVAFFRGDGQKDVGAGAETNPAAATKADGLAEPFELRPSQD